MTAEAKPKPNGRTTAPSTPVRSIPTRSRSVIGNYSDVTDESRPATSLGIRSQTPLKIRSAISTEVRQRKKIPTHYLSTPSGRPRSVTGSPVPTSPSKKSSGIFDSPTIDPEMSLIDWKNLQDDDLLVDDEEEKLDHDAGAGGQDKVLVSVRIKPADQGETTAWLTQLNGAIKLDPAFVRPGAPNTEHNYDNVLTGSSNKPVYNAAAKSHVRAAMEGYNAVVFAYGQTASGKTFTLSGSDSEPGIIPRAMRDVFTYIRRTPSREFLLRASYLEVFKEQVHDLLSSTAGVGLGLHDNGIISGLREEVVVSLKGLREVLERGEANRRTATTDWNARSSRSHSVFRLIIESRESGSNEDYSASPSVPCTPGGSRLQARGGRSVRTSTLSLIDLAGSERATSDKERTSEGKYINQSLLTLGTVISTLAENASKAKKDFVPFRNSKLTKLLQPSLSGNARISVICTLNPTPASVSESTSTLQFASRVKKVHLNAKRKEIEDTDALLERYRKEIEELRARLEEREREVKEPTIKRRLSARDKDNDSRAMNDLNSRIKQLTKLILTSQTIDESRGDESRPTSPSKLDFNLTPFQLQEQLLSAKRTIDSQATQILSLEATLASRPLLPADAPELEKDKLIDELRRTVRELEIVTQGYEENLGAPLRAVKEDVEREWIPRVESLETAVKEKSGYIEELEKALEKEKQARIKVEQEKLALVGFVREIDLQISAKSSSSIPSFTGQTYKPTLSPLAERVNRPSKSIFAGGDPSESPTRRKSSLNSLYEASPMKMICRGQGVSLLEEDEVEFLVGDVSSDSISFSDFTPLGKENTPAAR